MPLPANDWTVMPRRKAVPQIIGNAGDIPIYDVRVHPHSIGFTKDGRTLYAEEAVIELIYGGRPGLHSSEGFSGFDASIASECKKALAFIRTVVKHRKAAMKRGLLLSDVNSGLVQLENGGEVIYEPVFGYVANYGAGLVVDRTSSNNRIIPL